MTKNKTKPASRLSKTSTLPALAAPSEMPTIETSAPPVEGPGSLTDLLHFLDDHRRECNWGCKDDSKCEHKFSLNHGWELLYDLRKLTEDRLAKIPAPAQRIIRKIKAAEAATEKTLKKVAAYIPKNKRDRLEFDLEEVFKQVNRREIEFCVAYAYAQGVRHHERAIKSHILFCTELLDVFLTKHNRDEFAKAYLEYDWIIMDRDRKKAAAAAATVNQKAAANIR